MGDRLSFAKLSHRICIDDWRRTYTSQFHRNEVRKWQSRARKVAKYLAFDHKLFIVPNQIRLITFFRLNLKWIGDCLLFSSFSFYCHCQHKNAINQLKSKFYENLALQNNNNNKATKFVFFPIVFDFIYLIRQSYQTV